MLISLCALALAVEGMWEPSQLLSQGSALRQAGYLDEPSRLADLRGAPLGAVVSIGGCTASFVSDLGLLVTNHHCAVGMLQRAQKEGENLVETGFYAPTRELERSAGAGARIWVTQNFEDVTAKVKAAVNDKTPDLARQERTDDVTKKLVADCERPGGLRCRVASYYEGLRYTLIRQVELRDVRIVMAPPDSVGNYGDDIDNWHWPRHTGDFAFIRAYVGPDGKPAAYSPNNVPYSPPQRLTVSSRGPGPGEFVMIAGYPGGTSRWKTGLEVQREATLRLPSVMEHGGWLLSMLERRMATDPEAAARINVPRQGLSNAIFNAKGTTEGFRRSGTVESALARDVALKAWVAADPQRTAKYDAAIRELESRIVARDADRERNTLMGWMGRSSMLSVARELYRWSRERQKSDIKRQTGYQDRDAPRFAARLIDMQASLYLPAERELLEHFFAKLVALPAAQQPAELVAWMRATTPGAANNEALVAGAVERLFADPALDTVDERQRWAAESTSQFELSPDGFLSLAVTLWPYDEARERESKEDSGASTRLRPVFAEALRTFDPKRAYPDANGTLRVSFGTVQGYAPRDATSYGPQTRVEGIVEKAGPDPFDAPEALLTAIKARKWGPYADPSLGSVPVDFLADLDVTGGSSGSPTLDAKGRLVGLAFDSNYEGVAADYMFDSSLARSIHVDIRYVLFYLDAVAQADALVRELGHEPVL